MDGEERVTSPLTVRVFRVPTLDRVVYIELGQEESSARIAEPRVQAGAAPYRHVGAKVFRVGFAEDRLYNKPAVGAVVEYWRDW